MYFKLKYVSYRGFSFVYLAQDGSGNLYALKKIRCTLGTEEAEAAQKEVEIYQLFSHKNIIKLLASSFFFCYKKFHRSFFFNVKYVYRILVQLQNQMVVKQFIYSYLITR